jgi:hypothetical protein
MTTFFSAPALERLVHATIPADDPAGHVVVGTVDQAGAQLVASFRKASTRGGDHVWELQAVARHDWTTRDTVVGATVILKW